MAHHLAPQAERDLDNIWLYVAKESSSIEIANHLIDTITERCLTLASFPYIGRTREEDFGRGYRSLAAGEYVIVYCIENGDALILRVVHGRRNLERLFGYSS
jgi:toxin ParE1/3/4